MKFSHFLLFSFLQFGTFAFQGPQSAASPLAAPSLEKVAEGVYAWVQPARLRFFASNCAVIVTGTEVVVVDAPTQSTEARNLLAAIKNVTDKPVRYLVLTHWHNDHVQSDAVFRQNSPTDFALISADSTREDISARAIPELEKEKIQLPKDIEETEAAVAAGKYPDGRVMDEDAKNRNRQAIDRAKVRLAELFATQIELPTLTFADRLVLHRPGREIQLLRFRGHTRGDVVVYLPRERILIAGDLVDDMPFVGHGFPAAYVETLQRLETMEFDVVVPGHGAVKQGKDHLRLLIALYSSLVEQVRAAMKSGLSLEDTKAKVNLDSFRLKVTADDGPAQRMYRRTLPENVERAFAEASGKLKD